MDDTRQTDLSKMTPDERHRFINGMIEALETPSQELSEWEEGFVSSVKRQYMLKSNLSDKQVHVLERIYAEKTS